ncbi:hypothetical protein J8J21_21850, partial [Mycobacterium tuberculosis]
PVFAAAGGEMALSARHLVVLLVGLAAPAAAEEAKPWWTLVPDSYDGKIFSGTGFANGATEFHKAGDGLAGHYAFVEPDGTEISG